MGVRDIGDGKVTILGFLAFGFIVRQCELCLLISFLFHRIASRLGAQFLVEDWMLSAVFVDINSIVRSETHTPLLAPLPTKILLLVACLKLFDAFLEKFSTILPF